MKVAFCRNIWYDYAQKQRRGGTENGTKVIEDIAVFDVPESGLIAFT